MRIKIFRYLSVVDAFEVTPEYRVLAERLGLTEWNPVVWIGRLFRMDNDVGEHWFDNWDLRQARSQLAARHGHEPDELLIIDPDRFCDGVDGPCHPSDIRGRFWKDVLISLELEQQLIFDEARRLSIDHKSNCDRRTWLTAAPSPSTVPPPASPTRAPADPRSRGPA